MSANHNFGKWTKDKQTKRKGQTDRKKEDKQTDRQKENRKTDKKKKR